jgi:hypothetical protein
MVALVGVVFAAAACGEPSIPGPAASGLQRRVASIRVAVEAGEIELASGRLSDLARRVGRLLKRGVIDDGAAIEILDAIDAVRAALPLAPASTADPTVTPTGSPPPEVPAEEAGGAKGNEEGKKEGHGKGEGQGDEGHGNDD